MSKAPKNSDGHAWLRLDKESHEILRFIAETEGRTMVGLFRVMLRDYANRPAKVPTPIVLGAPAIAGVTGEE